MTIQGARIELINMLNDKNLPIYYEPVLKKVIETIEQEQKQYDELQEIRQEIQANMEDIIGHYSNTPFKDMPSSKIFRNEGRQECLEIIDKHISRKENN